MGFSIAHYRSACAYKPAFYPAAMPRLSIARTPALVLNSRALPAIVILSAAQPCAELPAPAAGPVRVLA